MASDRAVLTIATGKPVYLDLAINLARSFFLWNKETGIAFQLATDMGDQIPGDLKDKIQVISIKSGEYGKAFSPKLFLDKLAVSDKTLFIDSDCLVFGNLEKVFERFGGHAVSVIGGYINSGEWFGDITAICKKFDIPHMPKFNGGIYYLEKGETADKVYESAREFEKQYDKIGFVRLRNSPNDEVLMSLAMQLHGQTPVHDDGTVLSDPQACQGGYDIDVMKGKRRLINPPKPHQLHQDWYPFTEVSPLVVHLLGSYTHDYPYKREVFKLQKAVGRQSAVLTNFIAFGKIEAPARVKNFLKSTFRPIYRLLFGVRKVQASDRI